ncbi:invasion associated locus B family protein [Devosia ginsengisoli]|uniref:invasion associated locus B family protein n=1 Tax=Devosia ginsengisoli TaxID=400770 RepID=UPI0026EFE5F7|nr:invasion associated locus B family protein [Devosia ginsengisoli]MCR6671151.1 invasion associated locus B family protein [Devosia ginsengisoli]
MSKSAVALALVASLILTTAASAQQVRMLGEHRAWSSYAASDAAGAVCFAMTKPEAVTPTPDGYSQAYIYITNRPAENVTTEFNLVAGFPFQPDSKATVTVDGQTFNLFTQNDAAWLDDAGQASTLASAIRAGSSMVVEGTTAAGIKVTETYSLSGATAAQQSIGSGC